ncbi:hypothetical protein GOV12_06225 [Candidatus Pacearchaeota archaeon]|nr:hypothetical protein [Candidatus Pacearchaeota archaeon]
MVNKKKVVLFIVIIILIVVALSIGYFLFGSSYGKSNLEKVVINNPMLEIIGMNTDESGNVDTETVVNEGIINFDENYIKYIILSMGASKLHSSVIYGKAKLELVLDDEVWGVEIDRGMSVSKSLIEDPDLRIVMTKREAVLALLSSDIKKYMKDSVSNKNTGIEMISGKVELFSKGYLDMYKELTGEEIEVE